MLFGLLVWRGYVIAMRAPDRFAQLTAIGISSKIALQVLLNIAVVTNSIPNTGISLPFFSYGGTAMVVQLRLARCLPYPVIRLKRSSFLSFILYIDAHGKSMPEKASKLHN